MFILELSEKVIYVITCLFWNYLKSNEKFIHVTNMFISELFEKFDNFQLSLVIT